MPRTELITRLYEVEARVDDQVVTVFQVLATNEGRAEDYVTDMLRRLNSDVDSVRAVGWWSIEKIEYVRRFGL